MPAVLNAIEYVLFGVLVVGNFSLGLYFSLRKHGRNAGPTSAVREVFLGSRTLIMLPLAASTVASILSSTGLVAIPAHYYAYGWHLMWTCTTPLFLFPLATHVFVPVIYNLEVTSIFEVSTTSGLFKKNMLFWATSLDMVFSENERKL
ncbi:hypothetical protein MTO96_033457 [Rhipicephalus appendiculatus]